ncbi:hypothetical protein HWN72_19340 [Novosphingobium sp. HR1a]|nr:hypothetical protein [Novosphingobium sp. HR1a]
MGPAGISRWLARQPIALLAALAVRPAPCSPSGGGRTVGVALNADDDEAACPSSPPVIVATLTVFEGQAVFRAEIPGPPHGVLLFRLRRGSRQVVPGGIRP